MYVIEVLISIKSTRTKPLHGNQYVKTLNGIALNIVFLHILRNSERFLLYGNGGYMYICNVYFYQKNGNSNLQSVKCRANPFPICDWFLITQFRQCRPIHLICRGKKTTKKLISNHHKNL